MLSRISKMSVFGIVALMLAFAFTGGEALAAPGTATVNMVTDPTGTLNAGSSVDITITITVTGAPTDGDNVASHITVPIPTGWTRALHHPGALTTDSKAGDTSKVEDTLVGEVNARSFVVRVPKDAASGSVIFVYRAAVPKVQRTYTWTEISPRHNVTLTPDPFQIVVGPAADGSGEKALARTNGALLLQPAPDDAVLAYEGRYVTFFNEAMVLRVTYTPAGTMPENSTVTVTVPNTLATFTRLNDSTQVDVSGTVKTRTRANDGTNSSITAVVGGGGIGHTNPLVFTIKNANAPNPDPVTAPVDIDSAISVFSDIDTDGAGDGDTAATPATSAVGTPFAFTFTRKPPFGKATIGSGVNAAPAGADAINLVAGANISGDDNAQDTDKIWFVFTAGDFTGISRDSTYEIDIPAGWPEPFAPITGTAGDLEDGASPGEFTGRTLKGPLLGAADDATFAGAARSLQVKKVPGDQKTYEFKVRAKLGPHTTMVGIGSPKVEVTVGHGTGTLLVTRSDNTPLRQTSGKAELGNLKIVYEAAGRMLSGAQVVVTLPATGDPAADLGWSNFREDNGDAVPDRGEVTLSGKATLVVTPTSGTTPGTVTANINAEMAAGEKLVFTYKNVMVPDVTSGTHSFTAQTISFSGATLAGDIKHSIGIGRAPDGGGTIAVEPTNADAGDTIDITLTYTAQDKMIAGSQVKIFVPTGWPSPVGRTSVNTGSVDTDATSMTATTSGDLNGGETIVFTYSDVLLPAQADSYEFTAQSRAHPTDGGLVGLAAPAAIQIDEVAAGSIALTNMAGDMVTSADPSEVLGNLTFTFTAEDDMAQDAQVSVQIMDGWPRPFVGNNAADSRRGAVWANGATLSIDPAEAQAGPWTITATLDAAIADGGTLMLTYMDVAAPSAEGDYSFATMSSLVSGGELLMVDPSPSVTVRLPITALAITADPASVFVGDEITVKVTLWDAGDGTDSEGQALNPIVINLDDGEDADGTFMVGGAEVTSITIPADGHSMTATYTSADAVETMITATAMDDTLGLEAVNVPVTVKSNIRDLSVNGEPEMALVTQGSTIMVRATGRVGGGFVRVEDSDGGKVGLTVGLDPVGEPDADGDQIYQESVELPAVLADGMYTVVVEIQGEENRSLSIQVLNNQAVPTLSDASVLPRTVENGDVITLSVKAMSASESNPVMSVMADVSALDSTQTDMVMLSMQAGTVDTYIAVHTISMDNTNDDGVVDVTFTATDMIGGKGTATASVTLENDPSVIESIGFPTDMVRPGDMVMITATGTPGGTATFSIATGAHEVKVDKKAMTEGPDGTYTGSFDVVADVFPEGMYYVTVNLNTKSLSESGLNIGPAGYEFTLMIPKGTHAIHVPLAVNMINDEEGSIETVGDLYDALGDAVNFIISFVDGTPVSYLGDESAGSMADAMIDDDTGLIAVMKDAATLKLVGDALGTGGVSSISIAVGNNLVGVPLDPAVDMMISDALIAGVEAIAVSNAAGDGFHTITAAGDMGDGPLMGGVGYIVVASAAGSIPIVGTAWENDGGMMAAPAVAFSGSQTPVLHVSGGLLDEFDMMSRVSELRVTVKNLSTGASLDTVLGTELSETAYSGTFVEFSRHAAKAGDVLEITAHSPSPYVGVRPVPQIVVSADEVLTSRISLPDLELYEIPSETELLANFPNPFNPETWIPYRLAKAAKVSLEIYDTNGSLVRSIDVGFKPAAVYESRASAIYWDGRNNYGERVASGTYFYHLTAGEDYASTRRMVILK